MFSESQKSSMGGSSERGILRNVLNNNKTTGKHLKGDLGNGGKIE